MRGIVIACAATALLMAGCSDSGPTGATEERAGDATAETARPASADVVRFELTDMHGNPRSSDEWAGRPQLINFWATWCAPCRREIPLLKETQEKYADLDLQVIGIAVDFAEEVRAYAEEVQFNYPVLVGQEDAMAVAEDSGVAFIGLPFTMVVAPSGQLVKTHVGEIVEEHIEQITDALAALERGDIDLDGARQRLGNL